MREFGLRLAGLLAAAAALLLVLALPAILPPIPARPAAGSAPAQPSPAPAAMPGPGTSPAGAAPTAVPLPSRGYRAVWVSYLEWQQLDFSSAGAFQGGIAALLDDIAGLGATVVLAQVRPFCDALYPSRYYPFSHLCTGTQGQDPGFDPLALLVEAAHARGLQIEAWVNPYRVQVGGVPAALSPGSPASLHPDWVRTAGGGLYLDPANADVRAYIAAGLAELCEGYALDGIHFDDYFYPTTDAAFDAADYAAYRSGGGTLELAAWRRQNVDALVTLCWHTVHGACGARFGIAPQGVPENGLATQYSDAARWLAEPGYVDYLMPQLYWGATRPGGHGLDALATAWAQLPRAGGVALYAGLGAYRIGDGDGSAVSLAEWQGGHALADQAALLGAKGFDGVALYRYGSLFANDTWPGLAAQERAALAELWG